MRDTLSFVKTGNCHTRSDTDTCIYIAQLLCVATVSPSCRSSVCIVRPLRSRLTSENIFWNLVTRRFSNEGATYRWSEREKRRDKRGKGPRITTAMVIPTITGKAIQSESAKIEPKRCAQTFPLPEQGMRKKNDARADVVPETRHCRG